MTASYSSRIVEGEEAERIARRVWAANLPITADPLEKYRWFYSGNPLAGTAAFALNSSEPAAEGPIGWSGVGVRRFRVRGTTVDAAVWVDLSVDAKYRSVLPALLLVRAMRQLSRERFVFAYGYPNRGAAAVCVREGVRLLGKSTRYVRVVDVGWYLARRGLPGWFCSLLGMGAALLDGALIALRRKPRHAFCWSDDLDNRIDALWQRACHQYPILGERSSKLLRWRFLQQPGERFRIALLSDQANREVEAYAVTQAMDGVMFLRDVFGSSPAAVGALLDRLVPEARSQGIHSISMKFLGNAAVVRLLQARGFVARESERSVVVDASQPDKAAEELLRDTESWYLTDFDEDQ